MSSIVAQPRLPDSGPGPLRSLVERLLRWQSRAQQRRMLLELDDHMLKDIGLTRADVWQETRKPFWRF
jgi:uncharacterized protein YjiS (DUF1127 family)